MRKDNKNDSEEKEYDYYEGLNVGSQMDCTGRIPTPPLNEAQQEGYNDIYSMPQQIGTGALRKEDAKEQKRKSSRPRT